MPTNGLVSELPITQFYNCRILRNHRIIVEDLWVRDGKIIDPQKLFYEEKGYADIRTDCCDRILAPSYIDVQINGAFNVDFSTFSNDLQEGIKRVSSGLLQHGVTAFYPTIISSSKETYQKILPLFKITEGGQHGAAILGIHLEGPFINPKKAGAHPNEHICKYRDVKFEQLQDIYGDMSNVSLCTIAPEILETNNEIVDKLSKNKIIISLGHSEANLDQAEEAVRHGANFITHLFNAMLPFHHRDPGIVGLLTSSKIDKRIYYGLIADGIHTHPAALRIAHKTHSDGLVLITDAIAAMGTVIGESKDSGLGIQAVELKDGGAYLAGTKTISGSLVTMDRCVRHLKKSARCSVVEALECASLHPAQLMKIDEQRGTLDFGAKADFVLLDDDLFVQATYISGEMVWCKNFKRSI